MLIVKILLFWSLWILGISAEESATPFRLEELRGELKSVEARLEETNNIWMKKYANFRAYGEVMVQIEEAQDRLEALRARPKSATNQSEIATLERRLETLQKQRELMSEYRHSPFKELIQPTEIGEVLSVTNPILIIQAFSHMRQNRQELELLERNYASLHKVVEALKSKEAILSELVDMEAMSEEVLAFKETHRALGELESTQNIFGTTLELYRKKVEEQNERLMEQVKSQMLKAIYIGIAVLILFVVALLVKMAIKKYIHDNERIYTANKIINFTNLTIIIFILLFAYLENVTYLVTVLGFASAGLAIAMKDLFMSVLGWIVIVIGGAVHVGDRIKIVKDGTTYVGDVLDISILRITMHEEITLTTYLENRRAGRIIFVPNNYIFTTMFANYTHSGMKTVWDGIDFTITFESNHRKMVQIAMEITKKYAKGYTDITRKQLNRLRDRYSLRHTNVEPRAFTMLEPNGIRISIWYQTNSYAALTLRSTISGEIIDALMQESDIEIAYPTTTVRSKPLAPPSDGSIPVIEL